METALVTTPPAPNVGIVTIDDSANYGNRLQNYALQEALRAMGWEAESIRNSPQPWPRALLIPRTLHDIRHEPGAFVQRRTRRVREKVAVSSPSAASFLGQRRQANARFTHEFLRTSEDRFVDMPPDYWSARYAKVVTGSDQVWNPIYRRASGLDFLDFTEPRKRVAYAASFGVPAVPRFLHGRYADWLAQIPHLSVREHAAAAIVRELTGRTVPVVVDPTMLVHRSQWDALIREAPKITQGPYAVRFLLGTPTSAQQDWLVRTAKDVADSVLDLNDLSSPAHADVDPVGFVAAIAGASVVITDSFHASVFALLYRRPLIIRSRFQSDSRIRTLLTAHGIFLQPTGIDGVGVLGDIDWEAADAARDRQRSHSSDFLTAALADEAEAGILGTP